MAWSNRKAHVKTSTRNRILNRDGHRCVQCGASERLEVDHIDNTRDEFYDQDENLQTLCSDCHRPKTQREAGEWRNKLKRKPQTPFGLA